jgi:hypothetical protein
MLSILERQDKQTQSHIYKSGNQSAFLLLDTAVITYISALLICRFFLHRMELIGLTVKPQANVKI